MMEPGKGGVMPKQGSPVCRILVAKVGSSKSKWNDEEMKKNERRNVRPGIEDTTEIKSSGRETQRNMLMME